MPKRHRDAVWVQNASNVTGVLHSFIEAIGEARKEYASDDEMHTDPAILLMWDKINSLLGFQFRYTQIPSEVWSRAYQICDTTVTHTHSLFEKVQESTYK